MVVDVWGYPALEKTSTSAQIRSKTSALVSGACRSIGPRLVHRHVHRLIPSDSLHYTLPIHWNIHTNSLCPKLLLRVSTSVLAPTQVPHPHDLFSLFSTATLILGDDCQYPPLSAQNQRWRRGFDFVDSSGPIFSMYMEMAEEEDKKMAESWKADAEGILVFVRLHFLLITAPNRLTNPQTGLFSAAVASLISVSIQDIQQNPQDTSNFYLENIYQLLAKPNQSNISISLPTSPPQFSPPTFAVWVNSLWFLSLAISITCALLATLLQQWARRYLKVTQIRSSLHKWARIRSFFAEGVEKSLLPLVVEALPTLIHVSLVLFFAGLVVFLWNVNLTLFKVVLSWVGICTALYGCITLVPIFRHDSPYHSPLTSLTRPIVFVIVYMFRFLYDGFYILLFCFAWSFGCRGLIRKFGHLVGWLSDTQDMIRMTPEKAALKSSSEIDTRALMWTFDSLDEDHELDRFFSEIPGFHNSKVLKQPLHSLDDRQKLRLLEAVIRLLDRTFSSNLLPDQVKRRRADICDNAMKLLDTPNAFQTIIRRLASEAEYGPVHSLKMVDVVRRWGDLKGEYSTLDQVIFSIIVARVQQRDDSWFILASDQLGIPETVLRSHAAHGDNLSFAILIYVTRKQFNHFWDSAWPSYWISDVLGAASKFNVEDTSPELQHEFCALWNQVVLQAQDDSIGNFSKCILKPIRHVYIHLHQGTDCAPTLFSASTSENNDILDEPYSYPVCNVTGHVPDISASISSPLPVPHGDSAPSPLSLPSQGVSSMLVPAPFHIDESYNTPPLLNNLHPTPHTVDSPHVPVTFPDPANAGVMQDFVATDIPTPLPTPETSLSTSTFPLSSTSQQPDVSLQHFANLLTPSDPPNFSSSASNTVLDDILHTGLSLSSLLPIPRPAL